eukprot:CAMPEP_0177636504 /NCGR_PEP_ID=MMETSP0447-20121125/4475_1 /TAXON_ID=0 /ORGANISM="Stygamoeba regulata, Strain BSH-02190019" /LENGTH=450 /DNA_ID=CAMNT_0019138373 /DNA_START=199 /DNA_END=1548 /DNA_ORIENTATION=+
MRFVVVVSAIALFLACAGSTTAKEKMEDAMFKLQDAVEEMRLMAEKAIKDKEAHQAVMSGRGEEYMAAMAEQDEDENAIPLGMYDEDPVMNRIIGLARLEEDRMLAEEREEQAKKDREHEEHIRVIIEREKEWQRMTGLEDGPNKAGVEISENIVVIRQDGLYEFETGFTKLKTVFNNDFGFFPASGREHRDLHYAFHNVVVLGPLEFRKGAIFRANALDPVDCISIVRSGWLHNVHSSRPTALYTRQTQLNGPSLAKSGSWRLQMLNSTLQLLAYELDSTSSEDDVHTTEVWLTHTRGGAAPAVRVNSTVLPPLKHDKFEFLAYATPDGAGGTLQLHSNSWVARAFGEASKAQTGWSARADSQLAVHVMEGLVEVTALKMKQYPVAIRVLHKDETLMTKAEGVDVSVKCLQGVCDVVLVDVERMPNPYAAANPAQAAAAAATQQNDLAA